MDIYWWYLIVEVSNSVFFFSDWLCLEFLTVLHTGANVQKGKSLDSPLHAAAEKDSTAVVKLLLDFGADINARNTEFQRPVDVAPPSSLTEGFLLLYEGTRVLVTCFCRQLQTYVYRYKSCPFIWDCSMTVPKMLSNRSQCLFVF